MGTPPRLQLAQQLRRLRHAGQELEVESCFEAQPCKHPPGIFGRLQPQVNRPERLFDRRAAADLLGGLGNRRRGDGATDCCCLCRGDGPCRRNMRASPYQRRRRRQHQAGKSDAHGRFYLPVRNTLLTGFAPTPPLARPLQSTVACKCCGRWSARAAAPPCNPTLVFAFLSRYLRYLGTGYIKIPGLCEPRKLHAVY